MLETLILFYPRSFENLDAKRAKFHPIVRSIAETSFSVKSTIS